MASRKLTDQELFRILLESTNGVAAAQSRLVQKLNYGLPINVTDIVPQDISYFRKFCGPTPDGHKPEQYFSEILIPYRQELLKRNFRNGLDICLLGALRDDLSPGQWLADFHDDIVWDALDSSYTKQNPFSLLGALDVSLYRQDDARFEEFATEAVETLTNEQYGYQDDLYMLLQILFDFILNQINMIENGAIYPGHWKRMCAWMQAGLITRARSSVSIDTNFLKKWTNGNMSVASYFAEFLDARKEPMFYAGRATPQLLKNEILGRLCLLKMRHESEGRHMPKSDDIDQALTRTADPGMILALGLPGPLEGHRRPSESIPQQVCGEPEEIGQLYLLTTLSQRFAISKSELDRARNTIRGLSHEVNESNLKCLEWACIIASANRDAVMADDIADAAVRMASQVPEENIYKLIQVILQAAAAHEAHDTWFKWIEERLVSIANHLPGPPDKSLNVFQGHLDEIGRVLPIDSWFQVRPSSIASSGMA